MKPESVFHTFQCARRHVQSSVVVGAGWAGHLFNNLTIKQPSQILEETLILQSFRNFLYRIQNKENEKEKRSDATRFEFATDILGASWIGFGLCSVFRQG